MVVGTATRGEENPIALQAASLAYLGDCIYDVRIRPITCTLITVTVLYRSVLGPV